MHVSSVLLRETREGWPPPTVEIEVNGNQRGQITGVLSWLVRWVCPAGTRDFDPALTSVVGPVQNIFFLTVQYFYSFVLITQQAGQAAVLGRLSLSVCLWSRVHN
jgi:hypothetical protein